MLTGQPREARIQPKIQLKKRPRLRNNVSESSRTDGTVPKLYNTLKHVSQLHEAWDTNLQGGWWGSNKAFTSESGSEIGGKVYKLNQVYLPHQKQRNEAGWNDISLPKISPVLGSPVETDVDTVHLSTTRRNPNRSRMVAFYNKGRDTGIGSLPAVDDSHNPVDDSLPVVDETQTNTKQNNGNAYISQETTTSHHNNTMPSVPILKLNGDSIRNSNDECSVAEPKGTLRPPRRHKKLEFAKLLREELQQVVLSFQVLLRNKGMLDSRGRIGFVQEREFLLRELDLPSPNEMAILLHFKPQVSQERPMMPSLNQHFEDENWDNRHGFREPIRQRDKDWREYLWTKIAPNLGIGNEPSLTKDIRQSELHESELAIHNIQGTLLKERKIMRKGLRVSGHAVVVTVSGIGIAGRVFIQAGRYPRLIKIHAYCPFTRKDHDLLIAPDELELLVEGYEELLKPGRKRDLANLLTHFLYFDSNPQHPKEKNLRISPGVKTRDDFMNSTYLGDTRGTTRGKSSMIGSRSATEGDDDEHGKNTELRNRGLVFSYAKRIGTHRVVVSIYRFPERKTTFIVRVYHPRTSHLYEMPVGIREMARQVGESKDVSDWDKSTTYRACRQFAKLVSLRSWDNSTAIQIGSRVGLAGPCIINLDESSNDLSETVASTTTSNEKRRTLAKSVTQSSSAQITKVEGGDESERMMKRLAKLRKRIWRVHVEKSGLPSQAVQCYHQGCIGAVHAKKSRRFLRVGADYRVNTNVVASGGIQISNFRVFFLWHRCMSKNNENEESRALLQIYEPTVCGVWTIQIEDSDLAEYVKGTELATLVPSEYCTIPIPISTPANPSDEETKIEQVEEQETLSIDERIEKVVRELIRTRMTFETTGLEGSNSVEFDRTIFDLDVCIRIVESNEEDPFGDLVLEQCAELESGVKECSDIVSIAQTFVEDMVKQAVAQIQGTAQQQDTTKQQDAAQQQDTTEKQDTTQHQIAPQQQNETQQQDATKAHGKEPQDIATVVPNASSPEPHVLETPIPVKPQEQPSEEEEEQTEMCRIRVTQNSYYLKFQATLTSLDGRVIHCELPKTLSKELSSSYQPLAAREREVTITMFIEEDMHLCHYLSSGRVALEYSPKEASNDDLSSLESESSMDESSDASFASGDSYSDDDTDD